MLLALLLAWIAVSLAVASALAGLNRARRRAALPARCRASLERERVLLVDDEVVVVGRRLDRRGRQEVLLDCDGERTTVSIDDLLGASPRFALRPTPTRLVPSARVT